MQRSIIRQRVMPVSIGMADRPSVAYLFSMSSAFVKEQDDNFVEELPDRPISKHQNDVTEAGLALIEQALEKARAEVAAAQEAGDRNELARAKRDLRYWMARQATAVGSWTATVPVRTTAIQCSMSERAFTQSPLRR